MTFNGFIKNHIPIFKWVLSYSFKKNFGTDMIAGITLSTFAIPQSLAYATLAGLPSIYGLYSCLIPLVVYFIFGTSRHVSSGPFAITSILFGKSLEQLKDLKKMELTGIVACLTFTIGLVQLIMYIVRIDKLVSKLFNKNLVEGFVAALTLFIISSQLQSTTGLSSNTGSFLFPIVWKTYYVFRNFKKMDIFTVILTIVSFIIIHVVNKIQAKRTFTEVIEDENTSLVSEENKSFKATLEKIPIPTILVTIIITSMFVYLFQLHIILGIKIVGNIPQGLPGFTKPIFDMNSTLFMLMLLKNAIVLAVVSFLLSFSVSENFALLGDYKINVHQELMAFSLSNILGSLFSAYVSCASLTRSAVLFKLNAKSQFAALISSMCVLLVLVAFTRILEYIPKATLGAVIINACFGLLEKIRFKKMIENKEYSKLTNFLIAFISVFILDVELGLTVILLFIVLQSLYNKFYKP